MSTRDWKAAWAARRAERRAWGERMAAVDRDVDAQDQALALCRDVAAVEFTTPTDGAAHDPAVPVGCGCDSCQAAAQAVIDYWRERGQALRDMRDAKVGAWFDAQLDGEDRAFLTGAGVAL